MRTSTLCTLLAAGSAALGIAPAAQCAETTVATGGGDGGHPPGWVLLGSQHVRDGAERDLAMLSAGRPLMQIRVCARGNAVRLRNATAWMPEGARQKLWLPLVIGDGQCSPPIALRGAPRRVTHVAFEYEALGAGWSGARLDVLGRLAVAAPTGTRAAGGPPLPAIPP